jgi:hypothetical protein
LEKASKARARDLQGVRTFPKDPGKDARGDARVGELATTASYLFVYIDMNEFDIYLPATESDGTPVKKATIECIKESLRNAFGGYTHLDHCCDGAWSICGTVFHDEVTILRVLDGGSTDFDMRAFKKNLETVLKQDTVLIVRRNVNVVG